MADSITRRVYEIDAKIGSDALSALRAVQQGMKALEDTAKSSAKSIEGLGESTNKALDPGQRFVKTLKDEIATLGLSSEAILRYRAAQLGVSEASDQLISTLSKKQALLKADADAANRAAKAEAEMAAAIKAHEAAGASLVSGLVQEIAAFGKTGDALVRYKAGLLGVLEPVDRLLVKLNELKAQQQSIADASAKQAKEDAKAAADKQHLADSTDRLVSSLKREIDTFGLDTLAIKQYDAALLNASKEVDPLIAKLRDLQKVEEAEAKAARDAAKAQDDIAAAQRRRKTASDSFLSGLREEVATQGKSRSALLEYRATQLGLSAEAAPLIARLKDTEKGAHGAADGFSKLNFQSVGARRELLVLAHELSQGNYKQFAGSLLVLGERVDATSLIMSRAGLAVIGFAGILATLGIALAKGAIEQNNFNRAIFVTGNFAGQTGKSFSDLAHSVRDSAGVTIGASTEIVQALIESGRFGPQAIQSVAKAAANLERVSDASAAEIVKDFEGMSKGVSAWAITTNEKYHFLTVAQYDYIRNLEIQGKTQEAAVFASDALSRALDKQKENVGTVTQYWRDLKSAISEAIHAITDFGKTSTPTQKLDLLKESLKSVNAQIEINSFRVPGKNTLKSQDTLNRIDQELRKEQFELQIQIADLTPAATAEKDSAAAKSALAKIHEDGIAARKSLVEMQASIRSGERLTQELKRYASEVDRLKLVPGSQPSSNREDVGRGYAIDKPNVSLFPGDTLQKEDERLIREKYGTKAANELENAVKATRRQLVEEAAALKDQIAQYEEYGKSIDKSREAKIRSRLEQVGGDLRGASPAVRSEFLSRAKALDADEALAREAKAVKSARDIVDSLKEIADARALNARESEIASKISQVDRTEIDKTGAAYRKIVSDINLYVNAKHDAALVRQLKEDVAQTDFESKRLEEETALIGKNTLERKQAIAVLKLEEEARKRIKDNPDAEGPINDAKRVQIDTITAALERSYTAQRQFEAGAQQMFAKYSEDAEDGAAFAERVLGGSLKNVEDAIVEFTHTGKLSFTSLFQFMADEFTRQAVRINIKKLFEGEGKAGSILDQIGKALGDIFGKRREGSASGNVVDTAGYGIASIGASQLTPQQIESFVTDTSQATAKAAEVLSTQTVTAAMVELTAAGISPAVFAFGLATEAAYSLSAALQLAAATASSGSTGGGDSSIFGLLGGLLGGNLSKGSASSPGGQIDFSGGGGLGYAASGGVMSQFGLLPLKQYSRGGIADRAQLAIFGEGRKREAYIPMEDNQNVRVSVKHENGKVKAYAPLPGGRGIPVLLDGLDRLDPTGAFMRLPNGKRLAAFAGGGVMSAYGPEDLPIRGYAEGGTAGGTYPLSNALAGSQPYVPDRGAMAAPGLKSGDTYVTIENNAPVQVTSRETVKPNGAKELRFIVEQAVQEVDRRIVNMGSTGQILQSRGLNTAKAMPVRG